jgi:quercetin dioxygenase-like cupin family protein
MTIVQNTLDGSLIVRGSEAEIVGTETNRVQLLADKKDTGGALSTIRVALGKNADGAKPHTHRGGSEMFYVLDGSVQLLSGQDLVLAQRGDLVLVPPHTAHAFGAAQGKGAELLIVFTPGIDRFDYFRKLARIAFGQDPPESILEVQEAFDNWFLDSPVWNEARARVKSNG